MFRIIYIYIKVFVINIISVVFKIFPIKNNKIVVCSLFGKGYGDNPKYIIEELLKRNKNLDIVWLVKKQYYEEINIPDGVRKVPYTFFNILFQLSTAKIWIDNCRKQTWSMKRKSQIYIQTWHGNIGFKKVEKSAEEVLAYNYLYCAKKDSKMADLFVSSSDYTTNLYRTDFWYNGEILQCGSPRNDKIFNNDIETIKKVKDYYNIKDEDKILLYAPTFRVDGTLEPYDIDYNRLLKKLKEKYNCNWKILIRLHPNISSKSELIQYNDEIVNATMYPDMQELLVATNILVTDYSSSIFDYAITKKMAIIYASDIQDYVKDRGFEIEYKDTPFPIAENNDQLISILDNFDIVEYETNVDRFYNKLGLKEDGNASEKVADYIIEKIEEKQTKNKITKETKKLAFNTIMLYVMQVSSFIFPLITFPYLTRVLGADNYGIIVFTNAIMVYFQMLIDYGFLLSGTERCSKERANKEKLQKTTSSIIYGKLLLSLIGMLIITICSLFLKAFEGKELFIIASYIPLILTSFIPDYLFRGIERMGIIASRTVAAKFIYTLIIFVFVRTKNSYYFIPIATFASNLLIVIWSWIFIRKKLNMKIVKVGIKDIKQQLKESTTFFASRIATTAYGASNVFVLGLAGYSDAAMGIYGSANNLITYGRAVFSPISDSLYPYMIKNKNHKLVKKILYVLMPIILLGCIILFFVSDFVIELMCGKEYMESVGLFKRMIPLLLITLPGYLYGYPMLGSINKNDKANLSVIIGAVFHMVGLLTLFITKFLNFENVIYLTILTESLILFLRIIFFNKYKKVNDNKMFK